MGDIAVRQQRLEATVSGAVRRYWIMVVAVVAATAALAVGLTLGQQKSFRAEATVTASQPVSAAGEPSDQYLASQIVLLRSPRVADLAARIADRTLGRDVLGITDFAGDRAALQIIPPDLAQPGTYGANVVTVAFTWPEARVAQVGANSVLRAFDQERTRIVAAEGEATVTGIERALGDARTRAERSALWHQRMQALVEGERDLAQHPTFAWAGKPTIPTNRSVTRSGVIGLMVGVVLGSALAFARASRRRTFDDEHEPAQIYGAPLLGLLPAAAIEQDRSSGRGTTVPAIIEDPGSAPAEALRFAAGAVQRIRPGRERRASVAFVSAGADAATSGVVAGLAVAMAESGTRVLAVDADPSRARLTACLLPGRTRPALATGGLSRALDAGQSLTDCLVPSPLDPKVTVLPAGRRGTLTGPAYGAALRQVLGKGKAGYEVVLVDSPALLAEAAAIEVVGASDAVVVVLGPHEPVREHIEVVRRLDLVDAEVVGYVCYQIQRGRRAARLLDLLRRPWAPAMGRAPGGGVQPLSPATERRR